MARKKTPATRVNVKAQISGRLREVRQELFGEHGGPELARRLNLPARTWYNYETGVTVPAEVLLAFIDQTDANPAWLLHGSGPRFRGEVRAGLPDLEELSPQQLIRRSLEKLEQAAASDRPADYVALDVVPLARVATPAPSAGGVLGRVLADRSWIPHPADTRAARIDDEAMSPILPAGSIVAIDLAARDLAGLSGRIVAARVDGEVMIRWLDRSGRHVLLRPNRPDQDAHLIPLPNEDAASEALVGQVVWSWSRFADD